MKTIYMKNQGSNLSIRNAAIIAGIGVLLMAILAPIANFSILKGMINPEDFSGTLDNILNSGGQFRLAIFFFLVVAILDIVVAWALYLFLEPVHRGFSLLAAWLRIIYATLLVAALFNLFHVAQLLGTVEYHFAFESDQLSKEVMLMIMKFNQEWAFSLIIFGLHLLIIGYLMFKARFMKRILGILLIIASLGYLVDGFGQVLSSDYHAIIAQYTFIGELVLIFWLLISGWKVEYGKKKIES